MKKNMKDEIASHADAMTSFDKLRMNRYKIGNKENTTIRKLLTVKTVLIVLLLIFVACDSGQDGDDSTPRPTNPPPTNTPPTNPPPTNPPPTNPPPSDDFESMMLELINNARAEARNCGNTFFQAAPPLVWDDRVAAAALGHSTDMAENQFFGHEGSDGSDTGDRLMNEGYDFQTWGEDILVGLEDGEQVIENLLESPGHCEILMNPSFEDVGVGAVDGNFQGNSTFFWTLDLATEND